MAYNTKQKTGFRAGVKSGLEFFYKALTAVASCLMIILFFMVVKDIEKIQGESYDQGLWDGYSLQIEQQERMITDQIMGNI